MKNDKIKVLMFALFVLASLLSTNINALSLDPKFPGIDDATQAAFSYLKSKFGDEYFSQNILYLDTTRISKENALGIPSSTNQLIPGGSAARKENDSNPFYTNQINNEVLDYYLVKFKHIGNIENKYYTIGFVEVYLDSNYQIVRTSGVLNCIENRNSCIHRITEEQAYKVTSENVQFNYLRKTAQLVYNSDYNKIVWVISLYPEDKNSFGKSILIDSFTGEILKNNNFIESSYIYNLYNVTNKTLNTVEIRNPNIFQRFFEWLGSLFK